MRSLPKLLLLALVLAAGINTQDPVSTRSIYVTKDDVTTFNAKTDLFNQEIITGPLDESTTTYSTDNDAAIINRVKEVQFGFLSTPTGLGACTYSELFVVEKAETEVAKFKFLSICGDNKALTEADVTITQEVGEPNKATITTVTEAENAATNDKFYDFDFTKAPTDGAGDQVTVLVGVTTTTATPPSAISVNFYARFTAAGAFAERKVQAPGVIVNQRQFPVENLKIRSFDFNEISTSAPVRYAFQEGIATGQTWDQASPYLIYSNLKPVGDADLVQDALDLATEPTLANLKYIKDIRIEKTVDTFNNPYNAMVVTYKTSEAGDILVNQCKVEVDANKKLALSDCKAIITPGGEFNFKDGAYIAVFNAGTAGQIFIWGYNAESDKIFVFDIDNNSGRTGDVKAFSKLPVLKSGQTFSELVVERGVSGQTSVEVYLSGGQNGFDQIVLYDVKIQNEGTADAFVTYKQQSDRDATTISVAQVVSNREVFSFKSNAFSIFAPTKDNYVEIFSSELPTDGSTTEITITAKKGQNIEGTAVINVTVVADLYSNIAYQGSTATLIQDTYRPDLKPLPFNRAMFVGNNLKFAVDEGGAASTNFEIVNNDEYAVPDVLKGGFYVTEGNYGLLRTNTNNIQVFRPNYVFGKGFNPETLTGSINIGNDKILSVVLTNQPGQQGLIVTTKKEGANAGYGVIHMKFGTNNDVSPSQGQFNVAGAPDDAEPYFNLLGSKDEFDYTWWTPIPAENKVVVNYMKGIALGGITSTDLTAAQLQIDNAALFCPVAIIETPLNTRRVEINSYCANNGDSRIWTFQAETIEDVQQATIPAQNRQLNNIQSGTGELQICGLGQEYLILNAVKSFFYAANVEDDASSNQLLHPDAGYAKIDKLICMRRYAGAIIVGTDADDKGIYSLLFGNKIGDIRNRYHSTNTFTSAAADLGISITQDALIVADGDNYRYIPYAGPTFSYNGEATTAEQTATIKGTNPQSGTGGATLTAEFKYSYTTFTGDVTFEPVVDQPKIDQAGTYDIEKIVNTNNGPIFNIKAKLANVKVLDTVRLDEGYQPEIPDGFTTVFDKFETNGDLLVASSFTATQTLAFTIIKDITTPGTTIDSGVTTLGYDFAVVDGGQDIDEVAVVVAGVAEGSQKTIQAFAVGKTDALKAPAVELEGNVIFDNTAVVVKSSSATNFIALALDARQNRAQLYTLTLSIAVGPELSITNAKSIAVIENGKKLKN